MIQQILPLPDDAVAEFPVTKYMGSKQRLLPFIREHLRGLKFESALDAFSGSGCVAHMLKQTGAEVHANDFLAFCFHTARATTENNATRLTRDDVNKLLKLNAKAKSFVRETYAGLFFEEVDCAFLDNLWINIQSLKSPLKRSLALAAASRACMKKRPRGLFTYTSKTGWDGRRDLRLSMREQFIEAVAVLNSCVFSNQKDNKAYHGDVFELPNDAADLVYMDPPYISPYSDCDYTRRYHFVEGYCTYWKGADIMHETKTKKLRSYATAFAGRSGVVGAFRRLFAHFKNSIIVLSYSSNGIPTREDLVALLKEHKRSVVVHEAEHRYHHGNQAHKVGNNKSVAKEYLFIAS
jgi:DNA adenine methylase